MISILTAALVLAAQLSHPNPPPFTIEATEDVSPMFPGAPRVQSFVFAEWKGRWVFIGGRDRGLPQCRRRQRGFPEGGRE